MKVLEINACYGFASTGTIVRDIEQMCWQSGMECYVATCDNSANNAKNGYVVGNTIDHKIHAFLRRINGKNAYFSTIPTLRFLKYIDTIKPDIVHLHNLHNNYININLLLKYLAKNDITTVITLHDCWFFTGGCFHFASVGCNKWQHKCGNCPKLKTEIQSHFLDCTSKILADRKKHLLSIPHLYIVGASQWVADECSKSILKDCDISYIHNGFNLEVFKPTPSDMRKRHHLEGKFVILAPASKWYDPINKSTFDYFVSHLDKDMALAIFGCSTFHDNLPDRVLEIGYIKDRHEMAALYSMADVYVNCTREDTLPGINLECQACGTPVITYEATGCKETVDGICGISVETGNYEALFDAMCSIKEKDNISIRQKCVERMQKDFEEKTEYKKYIELFRNISK